MYVESVLMPNFLRLPPVFLASVLVFSSCRSSERTRTETLPSAEVSSAASIHRLTMKRLDGTNVSLSTFVGKVLLVVNTASECGNTPQYEGLQALHAKYAPNGFAVLGFPSNDFGGQEPGGSKEIAAFCSSRYGVTFPMFEKIKTTGAERAELYAILSAAKGEPQWNFHKYLVDKHGVPVQAWSGATMPDSAEIAQAIDAALAAP
jgi:glutathione peroxidase